MKQTDLHLISWNRPRMTDLVIRTIHRNTKRQNFRLVVLDNGSEQATVDMLQQLHKDGFIDELIPLKTNIGLEAGRNLLFKNATTSEFFVDIDNDCLPQSPLEVVLSGVDQNNDPTQDRLSFDWLERAISLMAKYEDYAAISLRTQVMIGTGNIFEDADHTSDDIVDFPHPGGSFRIMRTDAVSRVGGWSQNTPGRGSEERYICGRLRDDGYRTAFAAKIRCHHLFGIRADTTERWGYAEGMLPEETGHSDISHPALTNGDLFEEIEPYCGKELAERYFNGLSNN